MKFGKNTPVPNWPKPESLKIEKFANYCGVVIQAIIDGLIRKNEIELLKKILNNRDNITESEFKKIRLIYSEQVDLIIMLSGG